MEARRGLRRHPLASAQDDDPCAHLPPLAGVAQLAQVLLQPVQREGTTQGATSRWKGPSTPPDDGAPSASLDHLEAQAAPTHPGAPPPPRGGSPWPPPPASGRARAENSSRATPYPPGAAAAVRRQLAQARRRRRRQLLAARTRLPHRHLLHRVAWRVEGDGPLHSPARFSARVAAPTAALAPLRLPRAGSPWASPLASDSPAEEEEDDLPPLPSPFPRHVGVGGFHRSHLAFVTDKLAQMQPGSWTTDGRCPCARTPPPRRLACLVALIRAQAAPRGTPARRLSSLAARCRLGSPPPAVPTLRSLRWRRAGSTRATPTPSGGASWASA